MTALDLVSLLSQATYVVIFVLVAWRYSKAPTPAHLDMTLFFAILTFTSTSSILVVVTGAALGSLFLRRERPTSERAEE